MNVKRFTDDYIEKVKYSTHDVIDLRDEVIKLRACKDKARKVIQAYSDYLEGEYEVIPEQKAGNAWLKKYEKEKP
jgi:hypothetical protein